MELRHSPTRSRSDLLAQSLFGVKRWLINEWNLRVSSPTLAVALVDQYKSGEKAIQLFGNRQPGEPLALPYALIVATQIAPRTEGFNRMALQKLGVRTGFVNGGRNERREKLTAVDVGLGIRFTTMDVQEALMFAQIWAEHAPLTTFDVVQQSTGFRFQIMLQPDPSVDIPQDREETDSMNVFTTMIVRTFAGTTEINKIITKTSLGVMDREGWNGQYGDDSSGVELRRVERDGFKTTNEKLVQEKLGVRLAPVDRASTADPADDTWFNDDQ